MQTTRRRNARRAKQRVRNAVERAAAKEAIFRARRGLQEIEEAAGRARREAAERARREADLMAEEDVQALEARCPPIDDVIFVNYKKDDKTNFLYPCRVTGKPRPGCRTVVGLGDRLEDELQFPNADVKGYGLDPGRFQGSFVILDMKGYRQYTLKDLRVQELMPFKASFDSQGRLCLDIISFGPGSKRLEMCTSEGFPSDFAFLCFDNCSRWPSMDYGTGIFHIHIKDDYRNCTPSYDGIRAGVMLVEPQCSDWGNRNSGRSSRQPEGNPDWGGSTQSARNAKHNDEVSMLVRHTEAATRVDPELPVMWESTENNMDRYPPFLNMWADLEFILHKTSGCKYGQHINTGEVIRHAYNIWLRRLPWTPRPRCCAAAPCGHTHRPITGAAGGQSIAYQATPYPCQLVEELASILIELIGSRRRAFQQGQ
mmetsp:Transcript_31741/g.101718  ORF Transcript_31741/g.101718 Transcript_31741/m.101718 type:complete len:427 (+) Transcript_31741:102-1382(+)